MENNDSTYWYVEPLDAHTNEVVAKNLLATNSLNDNAYLVLYDDKGEERSVLQVESHAFIARLYRDRAKFDLKFKVYSRQNTNSPIRAWNFSDPVYQRAMKMKKKLRALQNTKKEGI